MVDSDLVVRTPFYFGPDGKKLIGWLHTNATTENLDTAVVVCPPLAVEYMSTYRSMRYVADYFALAGIPAIRFDYHGTGDSSGFNDEGNRLDHWLWSIEQAMSEVKKLSGCSKVGLFGLRMGATLASLVSARVDVDFLVLWAALESGRRYIREIKTIQMTGVSQTGVAPSFVEAGGMVYWPQTADAISQIDLIKITPKASRVLIIPRDDLQVKTKLKDGWVAQGVSVEQFEYSGYSEMLLLALKSVVPHETIHKVVSWVRAGIDCPSATECEAADLDVATSIWVKSIYDKEKYGQNESKVKESFVRFGSDNNNFAILVEPPEIISPERPIIIIASSGATHRVGPSRLYVSLARSLASEGFRCLRIDIPGLGDSITHDHEQENREYIDKSSDVIRQAMESFGSAYKKNRYVVTGLCSGAYFSFHAALDLKNVDIVESILINPLTFYWYEGMEFDSSPAKNFGHWNWYMKALKDPSSWLRLIRGGSDYSELYETIKNRIKIIISAKINSIKSSRSDNVAAEGHSKNNLNIDLMQIASRNRHLSFILARSDPGYDILMTSAGKTAKKLINDGKIDIHFIEDADHTFSKYQPRCDAIDCMVKHIIFRYGKEL
ncbi:MAG: hypothetical protein L3J70_05825 [Gammaproteobacteria bacterium]|nr:hypothetical protein [Gammaproteobacteria bacterium]